MRIKKANGEFQEFDVEKVRSSLLRSGATTELADQVIRKLLSGVGDGTSTRQIFSQAFKLLRNEQTKVAYRYKLKQAVLQLGETGFPFEQLVARIFARKSYETQIGQMVLGRCVQHEIDVIARRQGEIRYMECKFSPNRLKVVSIQTPLYVHARMRDVIERHGADGLESTGWLVSNMRFSGDTIEYARCAGLQLLGWEYPECSGLRDEMDRLNIFPITSLHYLSKAQKARLIELDVLTCNDLGQRPDLFDRLQATEAERRQVWLELAVLLD